MPASTRVPQSRNPVRIFAPYAALLALAPLPTLAGDLAKLRPGLYVAASVGCDGLGGAGTVDFDGRNFSGHYQVCRTSAVANAPNRFRSTCIEASGPDWPGPGDIDRNPDKTNEEATIIVASPTSFNKNGTAYAYCGARQ